MEFLKKYWYYILGGLVVVYFFMKKKKTYKRKRKNLKTRFRNFYNNRFKRKRRTARR